MDGLDNSYHYFLMYLQYHLKTTFDDSHLLQEEDLLRWAHKVDPLAPNAFDTTREENNVPTQTSHNSFPAQG